MKRAVVRILSTFGLVYLAYRAWIALGRRLARLRALRESQRTYPKLANLGAARRLEILPLIDCTPGTQELQGEKGVSYLLRTDHATILFDVGLNANDTDPSPLLQNMQALGVSLDEVDAIVISHDHGDHIGGHRYRNRKTFSPTGRGRQPVLNARWIYTPIPMTYAGCPTICASAPCVIDSGVATLGAIAFEPYFPADKTVEQSLAVRLEGRGIVIVTGCGHPTLAKILARAAMLFDEPVIAVIGGLHYFDPSFMPLALHDIDRLTAMGVKTAAVSAHDSTPEAIQAYRDAFGSGYQELEVGRIIAL